MSYDKIKYNNQYNKENYFELRFRVGKEEKPAIDKHWKQKGYDSFAAYMKDLIRKDMYENKDKEDDIDINVSNSQGVVIGSNNDINIQSDKKPGSRRLQGK